MKHKYLLVVVITMFAISCTKKNSSDYIIQDSANTNEQKEKIKIETEERLQLISLITMDVFSKRPDLFIKFKSSVKSYGLRKGKECIYFSEILKNSRTLTPGFASSFLTEFKLRFETENFNYSNKVANTIGKLKSEIQKKVTLNRIGDMDGITYDVVLLPFLGSNLYFPFSENFTNISNINTFYCNQPLDENATTVEVSNTDAAGIPNNQIVTGADSWAESNATIVTKLDDQVAGNHLDNYLVSPCANSLFFNQLCENEILPGVPAQVDSVPPPDPIAGTFCSAQTYNIAPFSYSTLGDSYLFSAVMPHYRLMENLRWAFWSGSNRISFYKGRGKIATPNLFDVAAAFQPLSNKIFEDNITRKTARHKYWIYPNPNPVYHDDWRIVEMDNYQALTVVKNWMSVTGPTISFNANVGAKWDTATNAWKPSADVGAGIAGKIEVRVRETVEGEMNTTRRSFLLNCVGDNLGMGTSSSHGFTDSAAYTIRSCGTKFQYYFRPRRCQ